MGHFMTLEITQHHFGCTLSFKAVTGACQTQGEKRETPLLHGLGQGSQRACKMGDTAAAIFGK